MLFSHNEEIYDGRGGLRNYEYYRKTEKKEVLIKFKSYFDELSRYTCGECGSWGCSDAHRASQDKQISFIKRLAAEMGITTKRLTMLLGDHKDIMWGNESGDYYPHKLVLDHLIYTLIQWYS